MNDFPKILFARSEEETKKLLLYLENITAQVIAQTAQIRIKRAESLKIDDVNWTKEGF